MHRWPGHPDGFTRAERLGGSYELYFPDPLVGREFDLSDDVLAALEDAAGDLARLDATAAVLTNSEALARLLLRAEAVGSSQIEGLVVGARRLLKADVLRDRVFLSFVLLSFGFAVVFMQHLSTLPVQMDDDGLSPAPPRYVFVVGLRRRNSRT